VATPQKAQFAGITASSQRRAAARILAVNDRHAIVACWHFDSGRAAVQSAGYARKAW
jgi:hypothetical protein